MNSFYNDVNDWLSVGGDLDLAEHLTGQTKIATVRSLRAHGVTHVLDVRCEWEDRALWIAGGLSPDNYVHAPIVDDHRHTPTEGWYEAVEHFVLDFWLNSAEGDRLYVHCHMGINRGPSAGMLAMLTVNPLTDPFDAFLAIRRARPAAGLVYAEHVGARHLTRSGGDTEAFAEAVDAHWSSEMVGQVNRGIAYYRSAEGSGTSVVVKGLTDIMS